MSQTTLMDPAWALLLLTLAVASFTDLRSRIVPNWLVALAAALGLGLAAVEGELTSSVLTGLLAGAPFLAAALIRPEGMGMGDVKLAVVLGIYLGPTVWPALATGLAVAGLTGVMISLGRRLPPSQTTLPLAPFMALGVCLMALISIGPLQ